MLTIFVATLYRLVLIAFTSVWIVYIGNIVSYRGKLLKYFICTEDLFVN